MPTAKMPIPNSDYTVARNAIMSVVQDLKEYTYMGDDVKILFPNDGAVVPTQGSAITDMSRRPTYLTKKVLHVEVEEDTDPESMLNVHIHSKNNVPIFGDIDVELLMTPIYFRHNVTLTIDFRSDSRSEVVNWRNGLKTRLAAGAQFGLLHTLQFSFHIPNAYFELLKHIHEIKERNYPTNESFVDYFKRNSIDRVTTIHDPHGAFKNIVIQESQSRVQGVYEISEVPEKPERSAESGTYVSRLTYKFHYMKPEYMFIRYPVSAFNELIDEKYVKHHNLDKNYFTRPQSGNKHVTDYRFFEYQEQIGTGDETIGFVRYPYYDDKKLKETFNGYKSYASFLVSIADDKKNLLNLKQLGDLAMNEHILEFIKDVEWQYIGKPYESVLSIYLHKNDDMISYSDIEVTPSLDINSVRELDIRDEHRVVFDIIWDWTLLPRAAIDRLLGYPKAFEWVLRAINRAILNVLGNVSFSESSDPRRKRQFDIHDFDIAIDILLGKSPSDDFTGNRIFGKDSILREADPNYTENNQFNYGGSNGYGNYSNVFDKNSISNKLIKEHIEKAKRMKTVHATAIIAYNQQR